MLLQEIIGNVVAKRAMEIAIAGNHKLLIIGCKNSKAQELLEIGACIAQGLGLRFDARVMPVCPCGGLQSPKYECVCSLETLKEFFTENKAVLETSDIFVCMGEPYDFELKMTREKQDVVVNRISTSLKKEINTLLLSKGSQFLLDQAARDIHIRTDSVLSVANTIARLEGHTEIIERHICEAIQYACLPFSFDMARMINS